MIPGKLVAPWETRPFTFCPAMGGLRLPDLATAGLILPGILRARGLGLSLVEAVARLHDGEIRLKDNDPGLRVELRFSGS